MIGPSTSHRSYTPDTIARLVVVGIAVPERDDVLVVSDRDDSSANLIADVKLLPNNGKNLRPRIVNVMPMPRCAKIVAVPDPPSSATRCLSGGGPSTYLRVGWLRPAGVAASLGAIGVGCEWIPARVRTLPPTWA